MTTETASPLARALLDPQCYPHPAHDVQLHETHISWVFLAGDYAYKVKKPVALPFLDFSTLEARRRYCEEELKLNRRFAPALYLEVVEIRGTPDAPRIEGTGTLVEYALKMRRFPQEAVAGALLGRGALTPRLITDFATYLARFHSSTPPAPCSTRYGTPEAVLHNALKNFDEISHLLQDSADAAVLADLHDWTEREYLARYIELRDRHAGGMVREVHGDLHLGNIVALDGRLVPFDCIEFSAELRWNDVMSEVAFLVMDLMDHDAAPLAAEFLNAYLEATGVYSSLSVLRFYLVYRAMVRAKIHLLRSRQPALAASEGARLLQAYRGYLALAQRCAAPGNPSLVLMHGLSGSGKSTLAAALVPVLRAIHLRSDVERKRLQGLPPLAASGSGLESGLYDAGATQSTYLRLHEAARAVAAAGYTAIVDATFLKRSHRAELTKIAHELGVPVVAIDVQAPHAVLRSRIVTRAGDPSEATLEVLERQIATAEPIVASERLPVIAVDSRRDMTGIVSDVAARLDTLTHPARRAAVRETAVDC